MPFRLGTTELIIILIIVVLLFGVGRIGRLARELARSIREFRQSVSGEENAGDEHRP